MNKTIIITVSVTVVVIAILIFGSLFVFGKYNQKYNEGQQVGYDFLFEDILNTVTQCQIYRMAYVDQNAEEQVTRLVDYKCLNTRNQTG